MYTHNNDSGGGGLAGAGASSETQGAHKDAPRGFHRRQWVLVEGKEGRRWGAVWATLRKVYFYHHFADETLQGQAKEVMQFLGHRSDIAPALGGCPRKTGHSLGPACHPGTRGLASQGAWADCSSQGIHTCPTTHSNVCLWTQAFWGNRIKNETSQPRKPVRKGRRESKSWYY